jgi:membrane protein YdbS with pleckstrin-like domain
MWVFNLTWLIPAILLTPLYISRIEYSVLYESGESLPEIYVKKGIIQITRKHVPFRTITNISAVAGPFDRIFGIGSVNIQTAGYSGAKTGPEEKLEGIAFYEEVRDFILQELRKFRKPYTTATETMEQEDPTMPYSSSQNTTEMVVLLREIRDLLRKK